MESIMKSTRNVRLTAAVLVLTLCGLFTVSGSAQVGKGLVDLNVASEADLGMLPHMTPVLVKAFVERRPFATIAEANAFLLGQKLTEVQLAELYARAFIHVNLNTGMREEILLIPGAGARMAREFAEYRPWKSWAQFDKEIGKYVGPQETARLWRFMTIK
jgi:DNA uptake protein ComE-like DNA-binding protein